MIAKVDLEKTYNRVDWAFLQKVLNFMGFSSTLQKLIMSIVSYASLQVCWKGELLDAFSPSQGLCQGDSLSPYLFVLCMKTLHFKINWVILWKEWCPLKLSREVDLYPTFFFVDDFFLFGRVLFSQAQLMEHVLDEFYQVSGQLMSRTNPLFGSPKICLFTFRALFVPVLVCHLPSPLALIWEFLLSMVVLENLHINNLWIGFEKN